MKFNISSFARTITFSTKFDWKFDYKSIRMIDSISIMHAVSSTNNWLVHKKTVNSPSVDTIKNF